MKISAQVDQPQVNTSTLVVIDSGVDDYKFLVKGVVPGASVVVLTLDQDGVAQITQALQKATVPVTNLHIVSHGAPGTLFLGNTQLSLDTLNHYAPQISQWFSSSSSLLSPPSLLLYGCNVAAGDAGEEFIENLTSLTKAIVRASRTLVGKSNWALDTFAEDEPANVEKFLAFNQETLEQYKATLGMVEFKISYYNSSGPIVGSIKFEDPGVTGKIPFSQLNGLSITFSESIGTNAAYDLSELQDTLSNSFIDISGTAPNRTAVLVANDGQLSFLDGVTGDTAWFPNYFTYLSSPTPGGGSAGTYYVITEVPLLDATLVAGASSEPTTLPLAVNTIAEAAPVFDFQITDLGGDGKSLNVSQVVLNAGGTGNYSNVTWLLSGNGFDDVSGNYSNGKLTFSGLNISVANGTSETYTVKAYYSGTNGLTEGQTYTLNIPDKNSLSVDPAGSQLGTVTAFGNGAGFAVTFDKNGTLVAGAGTEPTVLSNTIDTLAEAVQVFDFTITDPGGTNSDGAPLKASQVVIHTSGTGDFSKVGWILTGPGASDVSGVYDGESGILIFSGLSISVADGTSASFAVKAYYKDPLAAGLTDGRTYVLGIDGDTDVTVGASGTQMAPTSLVTNGAGFAVDFAPSVQSVTLLGSSPTNASSVQYKVTFDQAVKGVDIADFSMNASLGLSGTGITGVSANNADGNGFATEYTVTASTGAGEGNLRLDVVDNDTVIDTNNNKLGGAGIGTGNFIAGPSYTIDRTAPGKPTSLKLTAATDSGVSQTDGLTNVVRPDITGVVNDNATITITNSKGDVVGTGSATKDTPWTISLNADLPEGPNTLTVKATDAAGNVSTTSQLTVNYDKTAPATPVINLASASDSGAQGDNITKNSTITISGTTEKGAKVDLQGTSQTTTADVNGFWSLNVTNPLEAGDNNLSVKVTDVAGNTSNQGSITVKLDQSTPAPTASIDAATDSGLPDGITNFKRPVIKGTAEAGSKIALSGDISASGITADQSGSWAYTPTVDLADKQYSVTVTATDVAANTNTGSLSFTVDTTKSAAPTVQDLITNNTEPTITGTYTSGDQLKVVFDNATYTLGVDSALTAQNGVWKLDLSGLASGLTEKVYDVSVTDTDVATNSSTDTTLNEVTIDITPPTKPTVNGQTTSNNKPSVTGTYAQGDALTVAVNNTTYSLGDGKLSSDGAGKWTLDLSGLQGGLGDNTYDVVATTKDKAGNTSADATNGELVIDTTKPGAPSQLTLKATGDSGVQGDNITQVKQPTITGSAEVGAKITLVETGQTVIATTGDWEITVNKDLTEGLNTLSFTATDKAGNTSNAGSIGVALDTQVSAPTAVLSDASDTGIKGDSQTNLKLPTISGMAEAGSTVTIANGVTTTAKQDGTWSYTFTSNLNEGANNFSIGVQDVAGNVSTTTPLTITVDTTSPSAPTVTGVSDNTGKPTIKGTYTQGDRLSVSVANATYVLGTNPELTSDGNGKWTLNLSTLQNKIGTGTYNVVATDTDKAGNSTLDSTTSELTIDITPPKAPTIDTLVTNDNQPILTGTVDFDDTASFTVQVGGVGTYVFGVDAILQRVDATHWSLDLNQVNNLKDGIYEVIATAKDAAGNTSTDISTKELWIDTAPPGAPTVVIDPASDTGLKGDRTTKLNDPFLTGTAELGSTVTIKDKNGKVLGATVADATSGAWKAQAVGLIEGDNVLSVTATDKVSNPSTATSYTITVDNTPPAAPFALDLMTASDTGIITDDNWTNDTTPDISGKAEVGTTIELYQGATLLKSTTTGTDGTWKITTPVLTGGSAQGSDIALTAYAVDATGNKSLVSAPLAIKLDTGVIAPVLAPTLDAADDSGLSSTDNVTKVTQPVFHGFAEVGSTVTVISNRDGTLGTMAVTNLDGSWTLKSDKVLQSSTHNITFKVVDAANNTATSPVLQLVVDTLAPTTPTAKPILLAASDSGLSTIDKTTNIDTPVFTGSTTAGNLITLYSDIDGKLGSIKATSSSWSFQVGSDPNSLIKTLSENAGNVHNITYTVTDPAGNVSGFSPALPVTIDKTVAVPTITAISTDSGRASDDGITSDRTLSISGAAEPKGRVQVFLDGAAIGTPVTVSDAGLWTYTYNTSLQNGNYTLTAKVTDLAGNVSDLSSDFKVTIDGTPPSAPKITSISDDTGRNAADGITSAQNLTIYGTAEADAIVEIYRNGVLVNEALADAKGDWSYDYTGTTLSADKYALTAKAKDVAGNISTSSTVFNLVVDTSTTAAAIIGLSQDSGKDNTDRRTNDTTPMFSGIAEANAQVTLHASGPGGAFDLGTTTADSSGKWVFTVEDANALSDGTYEITLTSEDIAGNTLDTLAPFTFIVDSTSPDIPQSPFLVSADDKGDSDTDGITNVNTPRLAGNAEADALIKVYDGGSLIGEATANGLGDWTFKPLNPLGDGEHTLTVTATDIEGNVSEKSGPLTVIIDTQLPAAPVQIALALDSDHGKSSSDGITNESSPSVVGKAEVGSLVKLFLLQQGQQVFLEQATADDTGNWSMLVPQQLLDGDYQLVATASDVAGNESLGSQIFNLKIDTKLSPALTFGLAEGQDPNGDLLINKAKPTFSGVAEAGSTVEISSNGGVLASVVADAQGNWMATSDVELGEGLHIIAAKVTDVAGNASEESIQIEVDTIAPAPPSSPDLITADDSGISDDNYTNKTKPTLQGSAELGATVDLVEVFGETEQLVSTFQVDDQGKWSYVFGKDLPQGEHVFRARITDEAGNSSYSDALTLTIDSIAPTAPVNLALAQGSDSAAPDNITNVKAPTVTGSSEPGLMVSLYVGSVSPANLLTTVSADNQGLWSYLVPAQKLVEGANKILAQTVDKAGNPSPVSELTFTLDTIAPAVPSGLTLALTSDSATPDGVTKDTTPTFSGTTEKGATVELFANGNSIGTVKADDVGAWEFNFADGKSLLDGPYSITAKATDVAGNTSLASTTLAITIDTAAPLVPTDLALKLSSDTGLADGVTSINIPTFTGKAEAGSTVELFADGASLGTLVVGQLGLWEYTVDAGKALKDGPHNITAIATDVAGNVGQSTALLGITIDTVVPAVPAGLTLAVASDTGTQGDKITADKTPTVSGSAEAGATVEVFANGASLGTTKVSGLGTWEFTVSDAKALAEGSVALTAKAIDLAGNVSTTESAPLTLTIDSVAPAAPTGLDLVDASDSGEFNNDQITSATTPAFTGKAEAAAVVELFANGISLGTTKADDLGAWNYTAGGALADGNYDITTKATDAAGNVSTASSTLKVTIDTQAPLQPTISGVKADPASTVDADALINAGKLVFAGATTDVSSSQVEVFLDGKSLGLTPVAGSQWSLDNRAIDLAQGSHTLQARGFDLAGNASGLSSAYQFSVDTVQPKVTSISTAANNKAYFIGETINIAVSFDEQVYVTGTPSLALNLQSTQTAAKYLSGSGTQTLVFSYVVQPGDVSSDLSYASPNAITLGQSDGIKDLAGNSGNLTLPDLNQPGSIGYDKDLIIQGVPTLNNTFFNSNLFSKFEKIGFNPQIEVGGVNLAQLFDETYYLSQNPDVANAVRFGAVSSAFDHFVRNGLREGRSPSALYSESYYLQQNSDIAAAVAAGAFSSGLEHFLTFGHKEGRDPSAIFSQQDYLNRYIDIKNAVNNQTLGSAFEHFVENGFAEGRLPIISLYSEAYYLQNNLDVWDAVSKGAIASGFDHFITFGQREGRASSPMFSESSYLALNSDVKAAVEAGAFTSGFEHYIEAGRAEGRSVFA